MHFDSYRGFKIKLLFIIFVITVSALNYSLYDKWGCHKGEPVPLRPDRPGADCSSSARQLYVPPPDSGNVPVHIDTLRVLDGDGAAPSPVASQLDFLET